LRDREIYSNRERGQAIVLMVVALGLFAFGALGLAIDVSQIYAQKQMAQTAADAASQAGIMSIFDGTNATSPHPFGTGSPPAAFVCSTSDLRTPCVYARNNGFGSTASDTINVSFPDTLPGATLSGDSVPAILVTVQRTLRTSFMRFLGPSTSTATAVSGAAIVSEQSVAPLLITHPTLASAVSAGGSASVKICGGPARSVQVNSNSAAAFGGGTFDLSKAGPADSGACTTGTGADFGTFGGPSAKPAGVSLGSTGHYVQPASPILDPYSDISAPTQPASAPAKTSLANGVSGCPAAPKKGCNLYSPGLYSSGISVKNETAVFKPGLYYMAGSGGFGNAANGDMVMATGFPNDAATGSGMMVFNTGTGTLGLGANSSAVLRGSDNSSTYKGLLFFQDRTGAAQTHTMGGGGALTLTGSIYMHNTVATMTADATHYQTLSIKGNSSIQINGLIVANSLSMSGTPNITFNLAGTPTFTVRQIAVVK
jgi:hypothetical protein